MTLLGSKLFSREHMGLVIINPTYSTVATLLSMDEHGTTLTETILLIRTVDYFLYVGIGKIGIVYDLSLLLINGLLSVK